MTPLDFLRAVWPAKGWYCLYTRMPQPDGTIRQKHLSFRTVDEAWTAASVLCHSRNVFFAIHSLIHEKVHNPEKENFDGTKGGTSYRIGWNMLESRAFFFDLDVGQSTKLAKKYGTQHAALSGLIEFCTAAELPKPMVVSSGGGLHVYWLIVDALPSAEWREQAAKLKALAFYYGLRIDRSRTLDTTSVLRPVGTLNHKEATPRKVELLRGTKEVGTGAFIKLLDDAVIRAGITVTQSPVYNLAAANLPDGFEAQEQIESGLPPVPMRAVMAACEQMRFLHIEREEIDEPAWYAGINVALFTKGGVKSAEKMSAAHRKGRVASKWKGMQARGVKPATCMTLSDRGDPDICARCVYAGKVKNPLMAARFKDLAPRPIIADVVDPTIVVMIPNPPAPYTRLASGGVAALVKNKDGNETEQLIYENDLYPLRRVVNGQVEIEQHVWRVLLPREGGPKDFTIDADALYDRRKFVTAIANQGIFPAAGNVPYLQDYMTAYIKELQKLVDAEDQCAHLGWTEDHSEFILPDRIIALDGTVRSASLSLGAKRSSAAVKRAGTLEKQVELLQFYNDPRYVAQQTLVVAGLCAPFYYLTGLHGMIVNASGDPGSSKSTALYTAGAHWGEPKTFVINGTNRGSTPKARDELTFVMANLPLCVDEVTHMPVKEVQDMAMNISQPGARRRLEQSGIERAGLGSHKSTIMLSTANSSLHTLLATDNSAGTAGSMRVFEIQMRHAGVHQKWEADEYLRELGENYGWVGEALLRFAMARLPQIGPAVIAKMKDLEARGRISPAERYYSAFMAVASVIGSIAVEAGLLSYNIGFLEQWLLTRQLDHARGVVRDEYSTPLAVMTDYLEGIAGDMVIVKPYEGSALGGGDALNIVQKPRGPMKAHYNLKTGQMWVLRGDFRDHCIRRGANFRNIIDELSRSNVEGGRIITNVRIKKTLGAGTDHAKGQTWCFTLNLLHPEMAGVVEGSGTQKGHLRAVT